jgi:hypothetical protein
MPDDLRSIVESAARNGRSATTAVTLLAGRTLGIAIGAIHTAVPRKRSQDLTTASAVIEKLTGICGHFLFLGMTTIRAGDC